MKGDPEKDSEHNPLGAFLLAAAIALVVVFVFKPGKSHAAGYEKVKVTHVRNSTQLVCPPSSPRSSIEDEGISTAISDPKGENFLGTTRSSASIQGSADTQPWIIRAVPGALVGHSGNRPVFGPTTINSDDTRPGCWHSLIYIVTYQRVSGGSGEVIMKSYPVGREIKLHFCPGPQGQPEKVC